MKVTETDDSAIAATQHKSSKSMEKLKRKQKKESRPRRQWDISENFF